jgi:nicotinamidase-related amidase
MEGIDRTRSALVVMDVQVGIVERYDHDGALVQRLAAAIAAARQAGLPVVYVVVGFRAGHPDISPANQSFSAIRGSAAYTPDDPGAAIHPAVAPQPGDVVVTKRRVSAFAGSDLDLVLRSMQRDTVVLAGISTSGVVLSTVREAADRDLRLVVLADGCADGDEEVHRVLLGKIFPRQATVTTIGDWAAALGRS